MPSDDNWDWPFLYYVGTVLLRMTPAMFWRSTPKKLRALTDVHVSMNNGESNGNTKGFIDNVI